MNQDKEGEYDAGNIKDQIILGKELTAKESDEVMKMLLSMENLLGQNSNDIGMINTKPHEIELTSNTPIWQKPRTFSEPINREIEKHCRELEAIDIIEKSNSRWSSSIVPVRKPDGTLRMCIDYRKLNRIT